MSRVGLQYSSAGGCAGVQVHSLKAGRTADTPLRLETGRQLARRIVHWHARDVREQPLLDVAHLSLQDLQRIRHEHLAARVKRVIHVVEHGLEVKQPLNDCRRIGARTCTSLSSSNTFAGSASSKVRARRPSTANAHAPASSPPFGCGIGRPTTTPRFSQLECLSTFNMR